MPYKSHLCVPKRRSKVQPSTLSFHPNNSSWTWYIVMGICRLYESKWYLWSRECYLAMMGAGSPLSSARYIPLKVIKTSRWRVPRADLISQFHRAKSEGTCMIQKKSLQCAYQVSFLRLSVDMPYYKSHLCVPKRRSKVQPSILSFHPNNSSWTW